MSVPTSRPAGPSSSRASGTASSRPIAVRVTPSAPACSRLMSSRFADQPAEPVQRLVGGGQQLVPVLGVELDVGAAQAAHRRLRRRQRRTQVVADRGEQRGAHPVGLGERPGGGGLLGEPFLAQRDGGLGGERLDDAPVGGLQPPAAEHDGQPVVDRHRRLRASGLPPGPHRRWRPRRQAPSSRARSGRPRVRGELQDADRAQRRRSPAAGPAAPAVAVRRAARCRRRWPGSARRRRPGPPPGYAGPPRRPPRSPRPPPRRRRPARARLSASAMVSVRYGGVKNQLSSSDPPSAATSAGQSPPTSATPTTPARKSRMSLVSVRSRQRRQQQGQQRQAQHGQGEARAAAAAGTAPPARAAARRPRPACCG